MPDEKGIYIDLLSHQHQNGFIPTDTSRLARMVGLSEKDFSKIWASVSRKFVPNELGLVNIKLQSLASDRENNALKNKIVGKFGVLLRTTDLSQKEKDLIKKAFKTDDFLGFEVDEISERLTEWFTEWLTEERAKGSTGSSPSLANANANASTVLADRKKILESKASEFKKTLVPFKEQYPMDLLKEFYEYWSEPNTSFTKMKWQLQETWDVKRRLSTWAKRNISGILKDSKGGLPAPGKSNIE